MQKKGLTFKKRWFIICFTVDLNRSKIHDRRKHFGWNINELARRMDMTRQGLYYYLNSKPTLHKIEKLAEVLDLDDPMELVILKR